MEKKLSTVGPAIRELAPPTHSTWATFLPARSAEAAGLARPKGPALIVAGDWNVLRGYGENGDEYWRARYDTVFERAEALCCLSSGPSTPMDARQTRGPATASACRPFTTRDRSRKPRPGSSTSCSPPRPCPTASRCGRSTRPRSGAPATTAAWSSTSNRRTRSATLRRSRGQTQMRKSTDRTVSRCESATGPTAEMTRVGRF